MFSCIFDIFYPNPPGPTFDLFLTYFNYFGVSGPLGRPQFHKARLFTTNFLASRDVM